MLMTSIRILLASISASSSPAHMPPSVRATASNTWRRPTDGCTFAPRITRVAVAPASVARLSKPPRVPPVYPLLPPAPRTTLLHSQHPAPHPRNLPCSRTTCHSTSMIPLCRFAVMISLPSLRTLRTRPLPSGWATSSPSPHR
jgi:hypothetical protein